MNDFQQALDQACAAVGLDADGARLLRLGSNAVYHLKAPVIARTSRPGTDITPVRRSIAVARWLESADYPAVRAIDVDQPVIANDHVVTFWQSVSDDGDKFARREVREFLMVTWIVSKAAEDAWAAAESAKRITALRTGASRMDWQPS